MPRHIRIGLVILAIGFAVSVGYLMDVVDRVRSVVDEQETDKNPFKTSEPLYAPTDPPVTVKIFFPAKSGESLLEAEDRTIFASASIANQAKQILAELVAGPKTDTLNPALPQNTRLQELFISENGLAFVDFTNEISTSHPGGILNEQATIFAIVNSLVYNLPEFQQVKILVEGAEKETLAGHCLLLLPLQMDLSITNVPPAANHTQVSGSSLAEQPETSKFRAEPPKFHYEN